MLSGFRRPGFGHIAIVGALWLTLAVALSTHLFAQDAAPADAGSPPPDPPGTVYPTGLTLIPPEVYRTFKHEPAYRAFLPAKVDLSRYFPTPGQQQGGTCASWATGYAARSYYAARVEKRPRNDDHNIPSPNYLYETVGSSRSDCEGGYLPMVLNVLEKGAPSFEAYPPHLPTPCSPPPSRVVAQANDFKIVQWTAVDFAASDGIDNLRGELAKGNPVIIGMKITPRFQDLRGQNVYIDTSGGDPALGHAIVITGYDDRLQAFRIINSWGLGWGDRGYAWISYDTIRHDVDQAYVMDVGKPPVPAPDPLINIADLRCAKLSEDTSSGHLKVRGFVGSDADLAKVMAKYKDKGADIAVDVRPWPQCEVLQTLDKQLTGPDLPKIQTSADGEHIKGGATLTIGIASPSWPAYVYASYVQADGVVVTLSQPKMTPPTPLDRNTKQMFGDGQAGRSKFIVSPPFGREIVVVLAARSPLFDEPLPLKLGVRDYLSRVRKAVLFKPHPNQLDREVRASVAPLITEEK